MKQYWLIGCAALCGMAMLLGGCGGNAASSAGETTAAPASSAAAETTTANTLNADGFRTEGQFKVYTVNGAVKSETGVDVSSYCGDIDWARVKEAGITFAMVRLGGRGYGDDGALYSDERAVEYIQNAQAVGIKTGGYFFSQATSPEEAKEEAAYCRELLGDLTLDYPIAYDWESIPNDTARTDHMTAAQTTACARAFCDEVKTYGWTPMLYASEAELTAKYDLSQLSDVEIWHTEYSDAPTAPYPIGMWQYSKTAVIDGIEGNADLDLRLIP